MIKKVFVAACLTTSSLFCMEKTWLLDDTDDFLIKSEPITHDERFTDGIPVAHAYFSNEFGSNTNIAQIIKTDLEDSHVSSDETRDDQNDTDHNDLIPLIPNNASQMLVINDPKKLNTKYRNAEETDWEEIKKRKYSVECPACKKNLQAEDISALVASLNRHTDNRKHKNVDLEDLIEACHKNITYDLVARCIDCKYICKTKYYTVIGAFKSMWTHYKNKHKKRLSHNDLHENISDSSQTKKYIMIRKTIVKNND